MGSRDFYPDEGPPHERDVAPFEIQRGPVTNDQFVSFVEETGYVTVAERPLDPVEYPDLDPSALEPGSVVFTPTPGPVDLGDWRQWWSWVAGACWRRPEGPGSDLGGLGDHPVVHVAYVDALAYASWAGLRLPTEAEFEFAAWAGRPRAAYAWGDERDPEGTILANTWRGRFPYLNTADDGWTGTSPVGAFPADPNGVFDLIGNVWEWTADLYAPYHRSSVDRAPVREEPPPCCGPSSDTGPSSEAGPSVAPTAAQRVLKGGSHLCAPEYCLRYRPAARSPQAQDTGTSHIGFRCVRSAPTRREPVPQP